MGYVEASSSCGDAHWVSGPLIFITLIEGSI